MLNKVIRVDVVGFLLFLVVSGDLIDHVTFLVCREISGVCVVRGDRVQIFYVILLADFYLQLTDDIVVFFLEHIGVDSVE